MVLGCRRIDQRNRRCNGTRPDPLMVRTTDRMHIWSPGREREPRTDALTEVSTHTLENHSVVHRTFHLFTLCNGGPHSRQKA